MTGGTITRNNAKRYGGGVYEETGTFTMTGGNITGNNTEGEGGGVNTGSTIQVSGSPIIKDNVKGGHLEGEVYTGGTTNNCNLCADGATVYGKIIVTGALENDAKIGVTFKELETTTPFAEALTGDTSYNSGKLSADDIKHFTSDNNEYAPTLNNDGKAVLKKTITVSGITAKSKVYDGNKAAELDTSKAVLAGEKDGADLTVTATGTFANANAGKDIDVIVSGLTLEGEDAYKYILATEGQQETAKADIEAKPATITADAKSKVYGEADPTLTATVSGVVEGETLDYTLARAEGENIGDYDIDVTLGDNPNYEVTTQKGKLTITKAEEAPDKPDYSTKNVEYVIATVSDVELPANWVWAEADKDKELRVGEALTATAEYIGEDKDNYVDEAKSVTVSITRNACTHATKQKKEAVDATCLKAGNSEYWYCPVCNRYYSDAEATTEITENSWVKQALGHSYGAPTYTWSSDNKTCTATAVCKNEGCTDEVEGHTVTETVNTASAVKTDSTTEKKGVTTYTAKFTNKLFEKQSKDVEDIPLKEKQETPEEQKSNDQKPAETTTTTTQDTPAVVEKGQTVTVENKGTFEVTSEASATTNTVEFTAVADMKAKNVTIPDTVTLGGKKYTVTKITANAFKGSAATTITLGKNINKIAPNAFKGSKVKVVTLKSKKLTKNSVKNALKGSKAKTVTFKVKVGSKKENKKYVKKYKKFFTKKNVGKKVTVK